jgi:putative ABC transport system ATP-binding protein
MGETLILFIEHHVLYRTHYTLFSKGNPMNFSSSFSSNGHRPRIELRGVTKDYDTPAGPFTALKGIDLTIQPGEFVAVVGKSGSGKSTLLNVIAGIDRPTEGEVNIGTSSVHKLNESQVAVWRGRNVGVVFQFFQLLPTLTVLENVTLPMDFSATLPSRQRPERALQLLERVGVADQANKLPASLSGGQQQRAAIARALANDPPILVADEPTGNLDSANADLVWQLFKDLAAEGKTVLVVTHEREIAQHVSRTVRLADGLLVSEQPSSPALPPLGEGSSPLPAGEGVGVRGRGEGNEVAYATH